VNIRVPNWLLFLTNVTSIEQFQALDLEEQVDKDQRVNDLITSGLPLEDANATRAYQLTNLNICANLTSIAKPFLDSPSRDPAELAVRLWKYMSDVDEENEGEVEDYLKLTEILDYVIKFLWLAHKQRLRPISYVLSDHPEVIKGPRPLMTPTSKLI